MGYIGCTGWKEHTRSCTITDANLVANSMGGPCARRRQAEDVALMDIHVIRIPVSWRQTHLRRRAGKQIITIAQERKAQVCEIFRTRYESFREELTIA